MSPTVSIVLPTFNRTAFIRRAIDGVLAQSFADWELVIVVDGSTDDARAVLRGHLADTRVHFERLDSNSGLGHALNVGLDLARGDFVAYLADDDVFYPDHLALLLAALQGRSAAIAAFSGLRHHYNRYASRQVDGEPLQLVQVMHRRVPERWIEREELTTDDLDRMFWDRLRARGEFVPTSLVTCEWVDHPAQRHKIMREPLGGLNRYRATYKPTDPLRFHSTRGNGIDEIEHYRRFRERPEAPPVVDGLKILLVGELAYNPERVLALEERGHQLFGLWTPDPYWFNTIGPLPFGHVRDLSQSNWKEEVRQIKPDIIYALLNWQAVPFIHEVWSKNPGIPFVWHFKEGPFICYEKGIWSELMELYRGSQGQIYCSPEMRDWLATVAPDLRHSPNQLVLDGDLPKADWMTEDFSPSRSQSDGALHTVVPGRPIGLHPETIGALTAQGIHVHVYGDFTVREWRAWIEKAQPLAFGRLHTHANVDQEGWVREFSQYDAGWLHFLPSQNKGDIRRADWDDLNYPARTATLVAAGLPLLLYDNSESIVATQTLARRMDIGIFFSSAAELEAQLRDSNQMERVRKNVREMRHEFTFDHHADRLIAFFREVVSAHRP